MQLAGVGERRRQHPPAVAARLADPPGEEPRVAGRERPLHLLEQPPLLCERRPRAPRGCRGRCRPRSSGWRPRCGSCRGASRPPRAAGRGRRSCVEPAWLRSTFASTCGRWLVTATRRSCASGPIATGRAPSERDEAVHEPQPLRRRRRGRRDEPGRALEELRTRAAGAARLRPADRVTADEAGIVACGGAHGPFRRADVRDRAAFGRAVEHFAHDRRELADRGGDENELSVRDDRRRDRPTARPRHARPQPPGTRRPGSQPGTVGTPGAPRAERRGRADQPGPDDREPLDAS